MEVAQFQAIHLLAQLMVLLQDFCLLIGNQYLRKVQKQKKENLNAIWSL